MRRVNLLTTVSVGSQPPCGGGEKHTWRPWALYADTTRTKIITNCAHKTSFLGRCLSPFISVALGWATRVRSATIGYRRRKNSHERQARGVISSEL